MAQKQLKVWYDAEGDYLEVIFDQKPGYFRETDSDQVMEKIDDQGNILGFSVLRVRALKEVRDELRASVAQKNQAAKTREDLPREVQEALVLDHTARHYWQWLDEPVPALDGQTPRDAAGDAEL